MKCAYGIAIVGALIFAPTSSIADTVIMCKAVTGAFIAEGQTHPAQEIFSLTFNRDKILATNRKCDTASVNVVSEDEIYLACELNINCVKGGNPVTTTLQINRLTGEFNSYNNCMGYMTWGKCQKALAKF